MKQYNHQKIEKFWENKWQKNKIYKTLEAKKAKKLKKKPFYVLDMFPYPSGSGLHVGHPRGYVGSDVYARKKRMEGYNVLHPMGFDAFGLPAEQYALENKIHPKIAVEKNIKTYKRQLSILGFSYDWSREIATTDPQYYKWTQWIFLKIYNSWYDLEKQKARPISELEKIFVREGNKKVKAYHDDIFEFSAKEWKSFSPLQKQEILMKYRLAYESEGEVNWCSDLGTVLANDEVYVNENGFLVSERGNYPVEKIKIKQWFLRTTAYSERLLSGLEELKWPESLKEIQRNWIGRSEGSEVYFPLKNSEEKIKIFTTRIDTIFGATFLVLAPEHELVLKLNARNKDEILNYIEITKRKGEQERKAIEKEKTGVKLEGIEAINPATGEAIPVFIADYVLLDYASGAIMAVPAHDARDYAFAKKYNLPIKRVILSPKEYENIEVYEGEGILINSGQFSGLSSYESRKEITEFLKGKIVVRYKMRDAIFARQRYWGEPIPLWRDKNGVIYEVKNLPLKLPNVESYEPTGKPEGPLAGVTAWKKKGYEVNTMPSWAGSSWYFLAYMMKEFKNLPFPISKYKEILKYWKNVNVYVGGTEHATGHLIYARFFHKVLYDLGYVYSEEPFIELHNQGIILGSDKRKMSKRWGNVINPDDVVLNYGADTLRLYEMFIGPFTDSMPWSTEGIVGMRRFIERIWKLHHKVLEEKIKESSKKAKIKIHQTIKKVSEDIDNFKFNTAISSLMTLANEIEKEVISIEDWKIVLKLLAPFAPYVSEEMWSHLKEKNSIHLSSWPSFNKNLIIRDNFLLIVQINGKVRAKLEFELNTPEEKIKNEVLKNSIVLKWINQKEIKKIIYIKNRLINIVI